MVERTLWFSIQKVHENKDSFYIGIACVLLRLSIHHAVARK